MQNLLDNNKCYEYLLGLFHPEGLKCPKCRCCLPEGQCLHKYSTEQLPSYRCRNCGCVFNLFSNTVLKGIRFGGVTIVMMIRGFWKARPQCNSARNRGSATTTFWTGDMCYSRLPLATGTGRNCPMTPSKATRYSSMRAKRALSTHCPKTRPVSVPIKKRPGDVRKRPATRPWTSERSGQVRGVQEHQKGHHPAQGRGREGGGGHGLHGRIPCLQWSGGIRQAAPHSQPFGKGICQGRRWGRLLRSSLQYFGSHMDGVKKLRKAVQGRLETLPAPIGRSI